MKEERGDELVFGEERNLRDEVRHVCAISKRKLAAEQQAGDLSNERRRLSVEELYE